MWKRLITWIFGCNHVCNLEDMFRDDNGKIRCTCKKCDKVLIGEYGLALPCKWERQNK